jgi:hypothetical protein
VAIAPRLAKCFADGDFADQWRSASTFEAVDPTTCPTAPRHQFPGIRPPVCIGATSSGSGSTPLLRRRRRRSGVGTIINSKGGRHDGRESAKGGVAAP